MTIESWLRNNQTHIEAVLDDYADSHVYFGQRPRTRLPLSDHGLCGAIGSKKIVLPSPFQHKKITVFSSDDPEGTPHFVGFDGTKVLDLVPGQFFSDHHAHISGISIMVARAPQLFINISSELTVLYATVSAIQEMLSLNYLFNYPKP